ncbi:MAG: hypothetical protein ACYS47_00910 [Planctomycetota bacterium]|jgi:hypothetical protein
MRVRWYWIAAVLLSIPASLWAREEAVGMGDNKTPPPPVKFYGDEGFSNFLKNEPSKVPPFDKERIPRVQRHMHDVGHWKELVHPKFAVQLAVTEYYFGQNFGRNLIGRFFREGYGVEMTGFIHLDEEVDAFLSAGWGILVDNRTDLSGISTRLEDIQLGTVLFGIKPFTTLRSLLGLDYGLFRHSEVSLRLGVGGSFMQGVKKTKPAPEDWFWAATTLGTLHLTLGLKVELFRGFFVFLENGLRAYSPPHASQSMRPHNETGPFAFLIWNGGFFYRFH